MERMPASQRWREEGRLFGIIIHQGVDAHAEGLAMFEMSGFSREVQGIWHSFRFGVFGVNADDAEIGRRLG